jgi:hypothetical protein
VSIVFVILLLRSAHTGIPVLLLSLVGVAARQMALSALSCCRTYDDAHRCGKWVFVTFLIVFTSISSCLIFSVHVLNETTIHLCTALDLDCCFDSVQFS